MVIGERETDEGTWAKCCAGCVEITLGTDAAKFANVKIARFA